MLYEKLILNNIYRTKKVVADISSGKEFSYAELHNLVEDTVAKFESYNLKSGDRVVLQNDNTIFTVVNILACVYMGLCFIPVSHSESREYIDYIIDNSACSLAVLKDYIKKFSPKIQGVSLNEKHEKLIYIIYTSGSTDMPKGVIAPEKQVIFCIDTINACLGYTDDDRILCCLPLSFDYGLYQLFMSLYSGATLILVRNTGSSLQTLPAILVKHAITVLPAVPSMLNALIKSNKLNKVSKQLDNLRMITSTGENFPVELINAIGKILPLTNIIPMYGLTECKRVSIMPHDRKDKIQAGSCGLPLPGTSVRLDDNGELIISGANVMAGYWNDPKTTEQYFFYDPDFGWSLRSGDLFRIDSDGFLYFNGRLKQIMKIDGVRISAFEIEVRLKKFLGESTDVKIISVGDEFHGEKIIACIASQSLSFDEVRDILIAASASEPSYRKISGLVWLKIMPLNANGKINIPLLIKTAEEKYVHI